METSGKRREGNPADALQRAQDRIVAEAAEGGRTRKNHGGGSPQSSCSRKSANNTTYPFSAERKGIGSGNPTGCIG